MGSGLDGLGDFSLEEMGLGEGDELQREHESVVGVVLPQGFDGVDPAGIDKGCIAGAETVDLLV